MHNYSTLYNLSVYFTPPKCFGVFNIIREVDLFGDCEFSRFLIINYKQLGQITAKALSKRI
jgi:hypothetical protein